MNGPVLRFRRRRDGLHWRPGHLIGINRPAPGAALVVELVDERSGNDRTVTTAAYAIEIHDGPGQWIDAEVWANSTQPLFDTPAGSHP